jgi:hypothetical protein
VKVRDPFLIGQSEFENAMLQGYRSETETVTSPRSGVILKNGIDSARQLKSTNINLIPRSIIRKRTKNFTQPFKAELKIETK